MTGPTSSSRTLPHSLFLFLVLLALTLLKPAQAHSVYRDELPNGHASERPDSGITCPFLGHEGCSMGAPNNAFGRDFAAAGHRWTLALCHKDSDGDGLPNGQELGDPCCMWMKGGGQPPLRTTGLSDPGDPDSTNYSGGNEDGTCVPHKKQMEKKKEAEESGGRAGTTATEEDEGGDGAESAGVEEGAIPEAAPAPETASVPTAGTVMPTVTPQPAGDAGGSGAAAPQGESFGATTVPPSSTAVIPEEMPDASPDGTEDSVDPVAPTMTPAPVEDPMGMA